MAQILRTSGHRVGQADLANVADFQTELLAVEAAIPSVQNANAASWASAVYGSSLRDWYTTTDAATITSSSNAVSAWADKGAAARNLTQATAGNQPTLVASAFPTGRSGIRFASSASKYLSHNNTNFQTDFGVLQPCTFISVMNIDSVGATAQALWDLCNPASNSTSDRYSQMTINWAGTCVRRGNGVNVNFPAAPVANTRLVMLIRHDGTNMTVDAKYQLGTAGLVTTWSSGPTLADSQIAGISRLTLGARVKDGEAAPSLYGDTTFGEFVTASRFTTATEAGVLLNRLWANWFNT
ncbi:hypothetical protein M0638_24920 [Roseomonas sp. NAR14]|uniref:Uncharacterized protein n=1 Tax=Roseomonas acroporae TaxID=2937791 RepID=A0A9X1YED6_9PROT|nr:hypothetical protein [Roseomonas acroporae]MCK8787613.1 hypothetical protein [Roseomonas acroporae]